MPARKDNDKSKSFLVREAQVKPARMIRRHPDADDNGDDAASDMPNRLLIYAVTFYFVVNGVKQAWRLYTRFSTNQPAAPAAPLRAADADGSDPGPVPDPVPGPGPGFPVLSPWLVAKMGNEASASLVIGAFLLLIAMLSVPFLVGSHRDDNANDTELNVLGKSYSVHIGKLAVPYYMRAFFVDAQGTAIPIADCAYHLLAEQVQQSVLGELPAPRKALVMSDDADMGIAGDVIRASRDAQEHRDDVLARRRRAIQRCGLNNAYLFETAPAAPTFEDHITRPPFWEAKRTPLVVDDTRVRSVVVARNGSRYYAVTVVRQPSGSASYRVVPALVAERDLLLAVELYYQRLTELAGESQSRAHCLCVAHFGIVNSGLYFWYDRSDKRWHLFSALEIKFNQSFFNDKTETFWPEHPLAFPAVVDGRFGVRELRHASKINVLYYDETSFSDAAFVRAAQEIEGSWKSAGTRNSTSAFALVLKLDKLTPVLRFIDDKSENACLQHCLAIDAVCAARLKKE